ncbi:hypothetical protein QFC20_001717 [Naganishia adeliensis]|uniref:Uncharacterized protein n=1 Tax=Naganishia adeliensis TaxID=92952 RepID=A0ACC2WS11_9TREE|nr:hypothetical protein QFC20_001717 [Naganishia adeliensis]
MPPKSSQGPKQTSLLGFFTKPTTTPTANRSRGAATPGSAAASASGSVGRTPASISTDAAEKRRQAVRAAVSPTAGIKAVSTNATSNGKPMGNAAIGDAGKPGEGEVDSDVFLGSSPLSAVDVLDDDEERTAVEEGAVKDGDGDVAMAGDDGGGEEDEDEQPVRSRARNSKRKITYVETDDSDRDESDSQKAKFVPAKKTSSARKKTRVDDDDFEFDDGGIQDEDLDVMMNDFESPAKSIATLPETDDELTTTKSKPRARAQQRPPPKPLTGGASTSGRFNHSGSGAGAGFMTQAERSKIDAKEKKAAEQDCFEFLRDLKDKDGHKPDHPEYDGRTVYIPSKAWNTFTPFERQFWEIKQNHFDTVLFFQKGKFYELYEKDAEIGHNEFDLKLTDRVKMKMVGVPEQSFDYWCAKFLAAGYKVGKVEQAETAIGMEMRTKANAGKTKNKADSIVRRELATVLTNGTVVDEAFLSGDEACHCVAIKEAQTESGNSSYGICILDAATGRFELTAFEDDVCRTKLETLFRQLRPRELGNLGVITSRLLRNILPMNASWVSLKPTSEFYDEAKTRSELRAFFADESDDTEMQGEDAAGAPSGIPEAITSMLDKPLAIEALGG